jgi:hypothetical protein
MIDEGCSCVSRDPFTCWARRYNMPDLSDLIIDDGGPCECGCHEEHWADEP